MKRIEKMKTQKLALAKETLRRIHSLADGDLDEARGGRGDTVTSYWSNCACGVCTYALSGCG